MKLNLFLSAMLFSALLFYGCNQSKTTTPAKLEIGLAGAYNPPPVRTFPSSSKTIYEWINAMDDKKIRAHGWDIWESINTISPDSLPIWENWFSGYELYYATNSLVQRDVVKDFEFPKQFFHASVFKTAIPNSPNERATSFNRFSPSVAKYIYDQGYNTQEKLNTINDSFNVAKTIPINRQIQTSKDSIDAMSFALKPVFQFISGTQPTCIPYWAGITAQTTTSFTNPSPGTWRQGVVVDPTGKLKPGTTYKMSCNGEAPQDWPVVSLKDFYNFKITKAMADSFSTFAATSGDDVGHNNQGDSTSVVDMVKEGNYALLMAMHVTGKEINVWTWQTFWWSPNPQDPINGMDRPASIASPWNNYNMNTAYYMVSPPGKLQSGTPLISFNPYLETNLIGTLSSEVGSKDTITWYGAFSNCMSCHRMAAWEQSTYIPNGNIDPANPVLFSNNTKTDFLWSIPTRAVAAVKKKQAAAEKGKVK
jgi:hypothetical protein